MAAAVNRVTQNLILALLGGAVLRISAFSTTYLNYVKPGFRPFLVGAGVVLVVLGIAGLVQSLRSEKDGAGRGHAGGHERPDEGPEGHGGADGHDHADGHGHGGPRIAWLMCLPVFAIFLIAPPALGSFAASRDDTPPPRSQALSSFTPLTGEGPVDMKIGDFIARAWDDEKKSLTGRQVRLTGFVVPSKKKGQWFVTRMQLACCAADAFPLKVAVKGVAAPPPDTWVEVTGTWVPHAFDKMPAGVVHPELAATDLMEIDAPAEPYED
ncbi:TIGR03943 family protein [Planomonospora sp. ID67723]|uniref:TIGR03943 family putative permease subunit n=1 Tax=Planomonospora sp. ID67723 TaxID=2738134 RepID=UPI0018C37D62|nr:TIGR03943 family protein [Planomonospora sp. ID67723]MBG0827090.1 TIGR03943 family protein [Planomonospora sp. ID67723]